MRIIPVAALLLIGTTGVAVAQEAGSDQTGDDVTVQKRLYNAAHHKGGRRGGGMRILEIFDTDGDGAVTQAEIDAFRANQIATHDANGDGSLSLEEYQSLWSEVMRERMVDQFQRHDDDGDGVVTAEEFNERFGRIVERMDRNGDGQLDKEDRPDRGERGDRGGRQGGGEGRRGGN